MYRLLWILFLYALPALTAGQELVGIWKGNRTQLNGGCFPYYSLELHIYEIKDNVFYGNAYSYYDRERYTKINFSGTYTPFDHHVEIKELDVLQYNIPANCIPCIKSYSLHWTFNGNEFLDGDCKGHELGTAAECPPGKVHLTKSMQADFPIEQRKPDSVAVLQQTARFREREKELLQVIHVKQSKLSLTIIDNGEVDGDTVSVLLNEALILHQKPISREPMLLELQLFPNIDYDLVVYAENQGFIPPNTSLLTIYSGSKHYEVRMSSNERKSATVRFRYEQ